MGADTVVEGDSDDAAVVDHLCNPAVSMEMVISLIYEIHVDISIHSLPLSGWRQVVHEQRHFAVNLQRSCKDGIGRRQPSAFDCCAEFDEFNDDLRKISTESSLTYELCRVLSERHDAGREWDAMSYAIRDDAIGQLLRYAQARATFELVISPKYHESAGTSDVITAGLE